MAQGKPAVKAWFVGMMPQMGTPELTLDTIQIDEVGDRAVEVGAYTMKA